MNYERVISNIKKAIKEHLDNNYVYDSLVDFKLDVIDWNSLFEYINKLQEENKKLNGAIQTYDILLKSNVEQNKQQSEKIGKLEGNWNELREWIIYNKHNENTEQHYLVVDYGTLLGKMQELEEGSDN